MDWATWLVFWLGIMNVWFVDDDDGDDERVLYCVFSNILLAKRMEEREEPSKMLV